MVTKTLESFQNESVAAKNDAGHHIHRLPGSHPAKCRYQMGEHWTALGQAQYCLDKFYQICPELELGEVIEGHFDRMEYSTKERKEVNKKIWRLINRITYDGRFLCCICGGPYTSKSFDSPRSHRCALRDQWYRYPDQYAPRYVKVTSMERKNSTNAFAAAWPEW